MRKIVLFAALAAGMVGLAGPAVAATSGSTATTFTLTGSALSISAPSTKDLGGGAAGGKITAALGTVTVDDQRAALDAHWTATAVASSFTTGGGSAAETVPATAVTYWSGAATATTGLGVPAPGQLLAAGAVAIDSAKTAFSYPVASGNNSVSWSPTVVINVPATAVAGAYAGTITHSVG